MKEALVSGLNDWLLNADPNDRRYKEMEALRDTVQGAVDGSEFLSTIEEFKNMPKPVAKGFAFDFELSENEVDQLDWIAAHTAPEDVWQQILNYLSNAVSNPNSLAKITYAEGGGPYQNDDNED